MKWDLKCYLWGVVVNIVEGFLEKKQTATTSPFIKVHKSFYSVCSQRDEESPCSNLTVGIKVDYRNLTNGSVSTGKLSLVALAGSEKATKTGATTS